ncbi:hypothetical protein BLOT_012904 [Blomia tropicalis]|nr:hypothetical protein BLOT_012904 [Blomia tropicalis]
MEKTSQEIKTRKKRIFNVTTVNKNKEKKKTSMTSKKTYHLTLRNSTNDADNDKWHLTSIRQ